MGIHYSLFCRCDPHRYRDFYTWLWGVWGVRYCVHYQWSFLSILFDRNNAFAVGVALIVSLLAAILLFRFLGDRVVEENGLKNINNK